jgi:hypothetical protein
MAALACLMCDIAQLDDVGREFGLAETVNSQLRVRTELAHIYGKEVTFLPRHRATA